MGTYPSWLRFGYVGTTDEWRTAFSAKQDQLTYNPVNKAGDVMLGPLGIAASNEVTAGLNLAIGVAPITPREGDVWTTAAGFFGFIDGRTIEFGGRNKRTRVVTGDFTLGADDDVVFINLGAPGAVAVTLDQVSAIGDGKEFLVVDMAGNVTTATFTHHAGDNIMGRTGTYTMNSSGSAGGGFSLRLTTSTALSGWATG